MEPQESPASGPPDQALTERSYQHRHSISLPDSETAQNPPILDETPLTHENLYLWNQLFDATDSNIIADENSTTPSVADSDRKLNFYRIFIDEGKELPQELRNHINNIVKAPREADTPSAKNAAKKHRRLKIRDEDDMLSDIADDVFIIRHPSVLEAKKFRLSRDYLPSPPDDQTKGLGVLSQAQPDLLLGYLPRAGTTDEDDEPPFEEWEERDLRLYMPLSNRPPYLPFLTSQWKSEIGQGTMRVANQQSARDGACIVNHLYQFFKDANQAEPSIVDTCHFSLTLDIRSVQLWAHWREDKEEHTCGKVSKVPQYHMELIHQCYLSAPGNKVDTAMVDLRKMLHNIVEYSVGRRLQNIKAAIKCLHERNFHS